MRGFRSEQDCGEDSRKMDLAAGSGARPEGPQRGSSKGSRTPSTALLLLLVFVVGLGTGYLLRGLLLARRPMNATHASLKGPAMLRQVNPPGGYTLPASFRDVGPQLLRAGAIDYERFAQLYERAGRPLNEEQREVVTQGSVAPIVVGRQNAYFLLNFSWALGLANENPLLKEGEMMRAGQREIERFASTGGWSLAAKPIVELYASTPLVRLNPEQQARLARVASAVYRPCCNNPTSFPDCNHGMAMLGLLELMASQGASECTLFMAAKYLNAFWFPQQMLEVATYFKMTRGLDFADLDPRRAVAADFFSRKGFQRVHRWLAARGLLEAAPKDGVSCGA